jgi:DNA-binding LacI/PurR family transcriptional regulator
VFSGFRYPPDVKAPQLALPRVLAEQGVVDGVILAGQHSANLLEALDHAGIPWVLAGNNFVGPARCTSRFTIYYDEQGGISDAARYLGRLGHRRVAFVGNAALPWFRRRLEVFRSVLAAQARHLMEVCDDWRVSNIEYGSLAAARLLRLERRPTAILAANDEIAAGVWMELTQQGVRIPAEISLIGFGDREEFQILRPPLTTVSVFPQKLGAGLAEMLIQRLENPKARIEARVLPCQLMERASCGPPPN